LLILRRYYKYYQVLHAVFSYLACYPAAALCRYHGVVHHMLLLLLLPARCVLLPLRGFALLICYLIEARRLQHLVCLQPALEIAE
jgi:hypothetical protein